MSILPIDSCRYGSEEMKEIFKEDMKLQYQLIFEAEVAITQAILNIIPPVAAKEISMLARSRKITLKRVKLSTVYWRRANWMRWRLHRLRKASKADRPS